MGKLNIAELLKDCPKGMELDCTLFTDNCLEFNDIVNTNKLFPIRCHIKDPNGGYTVFHFTKHGCLLNSPFAKCIIFPKDKTTWEGFQRPFKDGDIVAIDSDGGAQVFIFKEYIDADGGFAYCYAMLDDNGVLDLEFGHYYVTRFATEGEKQKLFDAIKKNGYKWNAETKTLEKLIEPKFKVGDTIKSICSQIKYKVTDIRDDVYIIHNSGDKFGYHISFKEENNYELVPNKFDITTLKPFESRVLVRHNDDNKWGGAFFSYIDGDFHSHCYKFVTTAGKSYPKMIPYEGNEYLLGTANDCDNFYKTWE